MKAKVIALTEEYIPQMVEIEELVFPVPWSKAAYEYEFAKNEMAHYLGWVEEGKLLGFGGFWQILDEAHIGNIAVHPDSHRKGIGTAIMDMLVSYAIGLGCIAVTLEVRESNLPAISFYEGLGFASAGTRPGYYQDNGEDALIMWLNLED